MSLWFFLVCGCGSQEEPAAANVEPPPPAAVVQSTYSPPTRPGAAVVVMGKSTAVPVAVHRDGASSPSGKAEEALALTWKDWLADNRQALKYIDKYHLAKDEKGAKESWVHAYHDVYLRDLARYTAGRIPEAENTETEYVFGQLLVALDSPDRAGEQEALNRVRARLERLEAALEAAEAAPPPPVDAAAPASP